jgi:hypothetical protein
MTDATPITPGAEQSANRNATLRDFPWPYRSMLAICSDIDDETPEHFAELHRFMNTREMTSLGRGVGLDITDSVWFYAPPSDGDDPAETQLSFFSGLDWTTRSPFADRILAYIRGGWIDTLHTYGNFSESPIGGPTQFTRAHAEHALAVLRDHGLSISVWSNHGNNNNIQNVEKDGDMPGDVPDHPAHHSDLMTQAGVRFIWSTIMSDQFGRDDIVTLATLRDGQKIWKFSRNDIAYRDDAERLKTRFGASTQQTSRGPMAILWHPALLHVQLSAINLAELVAKGGYAIVGQHLGYRGPHADPAAVLPPEAVEALYRLKALQDAGGILVAGTARLLNYAVTRKCLRFETATDSDGKTIIDITGIDDPVAGGRPVDIVHLRGISFEIANGVGELRVLGEPVPPSELVEDHRPGRHILGIRWFEPDHTDYTAECAP